MSWGDAKVVARVWRGWKVPGGSDCVVVQKATACTRNRKCGQQRFRHPSLFNSRMGGGYVPHEGDARSQAGVGRGGTPPDSVRRSICATAQLRSFAMHRLSDAPGNRAIGGEDHVINGAVCLSEKPYIFLLYPCWPVRIHVHHQGRLSGLEI